MARSLEAMPSTQDQVYARWRNEPQRFWAEAADSVHWYRRWNEVLDASRPPYYRWFSGGLVNTCYNALDRHVAGGRADQPALIYDSPVTQTIPATRQSSSPPPSRAAASFSSDRKSGPRWARVATRTGRSSWRERSLRSACR